MRTILSLGVLVLLTGCCNCPWAQVPENPHYKPTPAAERPE